MRDGSAWRTRCMSSMTYSKQESNQRTDPTKQEIRERVWQAMEKAGIRRFPGPRGRIPNFAGAERAAERLCELDVWKRAKVLKCNPDLPQRPVRLRALKEEKIVYMAVPRLRELQCFIELDPSRLGNNISKASSIEGAF